jgi:hypothetical protein
MHSSRIGTCRNKKILALLVQIIVEGGLPPVYVREINNQARYAESYQPGQQQWPVAAVVILGFSH